MFQNPDDQLFMPTVYDDVAFGLRNRGMPEAEVRERVADCLDRLRIGTLASRTPLKLSGGEKRMAALATVLVMEPSVMLLDEPTHFSIRAPGGSLSQALSELHQARIIATHDLSFAARYCTRVVLIHEGRVFAEGDPDRLLRDAGTMEACGIEAID